MKYALIIFSLFLSTTTIAQEWGDMQKNELTMKELAPVWPGCESGTASQRDNCFIPSMLIKRMNKDAWW
jgi:periplasmic protein TonB